MFGQLEDLAARIARPPRRWTHDALWRAYELAGLTAASGTSRRGVADLAAIIRFELGADDQLLPYAAAIDRRYRAWLASREQGGARFTGDQLWWLENIAQATAMTVRFDTADLDHVPFSSRGGTDGFLAAFGDDQAVSILDDLDEDLTA